MNDLLDYPFDPKIILKKRKMLKRQLLSSGESFLKKNIAILGGSTTKDIIDILEIFLLRNGIEPVFYESEFGQYWEDAVFDNPYLDKFDPEIIYIHTNNRNLNFYPSPNDSRERAQEILSSEYSRYQKMWESLKKKYGCLIIQNNFEMPYFRILGNLDTVDYRGRTKFILEMNRCFSEYAETQKNFIINDINYLSACYGLDQWSSPQTWYLYKYFLELDAIPYFTYNIANIIKAVLGKNKKVLVLDLDNTLWDGVIGDDGLDGIEIGEETSIGQSYKEFQSYIKMIKETGILLAINSKNYLENAISGLNHPGGIIEQEDFVNIKANWKTKDSNIKEIAKELNLGIDSLVFIDDNPMERDIVRKGAKDVAVPEIGEIQDYIRVIDRAGYFEILDLSKEDISRNSMYKANIMRKNTEADFFDYDEYLSSLEMTAHVNSFETIHLSRITQLINKTNQFNLTSKRYTQADVEEMTSDKSIITISGRLEDKFGDNGITSLVIGKISGHILHINLWVMSCRVLKRNFENVMMDALHGVAKENKIKRLKGYYNQTSKNKMVTDFYKRFGFSLIDKKGNDTVWELDTEKYLQKNNLIKVINKL